MALSNKKETVVEESTTEATVVTETAPAPKKAKLKKGAEVTVKNISNFTQHHEGQYFSPGLEVRTTYDNFIKASIDSGIFVLLDK